MKTRLLAILFLTLGLILTLFWTVAAQEGEPITLSINLVTEPPTLDPALATDTTSSSVIEQLFIGLVDLDDETAQVKPELATDWDISPDGTVYTFTLRNDVRWTDGSQVTANDVRYGILRSLNPATASGYAYILFNIKNAEAYHNGQITDPNQVGVTVLDDTHLRIILEYPATSILSILSMGVARPMPQQAIEIWGDAWTEPNHIVSNGAYRLTEWDHEDHILLDKNPTYYDVTNVQIERVMMRMIQDGDAAWALYLNGELDMADVPRDANLDPILRQEVRIQPRPCTYYYGFSISQPPFDDPLVRKAFIAATNRRGLIDSVLGGAQQPALTFTPPGIFGYVDGYAEGVGVPYNPVQARQWLAEAGYPDGQGLPPITISFNTGAGHQAIAGYIRDSWNAALGTNAALHDLEWGDYIGQLDAGQFQVWRMGWCIDYPDAYNFLHDAVVPRQGAYGGWHNATYESLLDLAARETDPDIRKDLYKQAERILVETDVVMMPLYYYTSVKAVKSYLERTSSAIGGFDISTWRITRVHGAATPESGGVLTSYHGDTAIQIPPGAISDTVSITLSPAYGMLSAGGDLTGIDHVFDVTIVDQQTGQPAQLAPDKDYTLSVQYTDEEEGPAIEETLALYWWDGSQWVKEPSSVVDAVSNTVTATPDHFSLWAVLGETKRMYLPLVPKSY